jgi:hypothetical protein
MDLRPHPAAEIFPMMDGTDFDALVTDIRQHGLREPIVLKDGLILDGRNRYRACRQLGLEPMCEEWRGQGTPEEFVVSMNLHRRHLSESQRAMIGNRLARLVKGQHRHQEDSDRQICLSQKQAAELLNVSERTIRDARVVQAGGTPEEIAAVERGEVAVATIANQVRKGMSDEQRKKKRSEPISSVGKNPERIQKQQINAEIWGRVRDALTHLTSLPLPQDVAAVARASDKTGLIDARLSKAMQWLKEFENVWSRNRSEDAA